MESTSTLCCCQHCDAHGKRCSRSLSHGQPYPSLPSISFSAFGTGKAAFSHQSELPHRHSVASSVHGPSRGEWTGWGSQEWSGAGEPATSKCLARCRANSCSHTVVVRCGSFRLMLRLCCVGCPSRHAAELRPHGHPAIHPSGLLALRKSMLLRVKGTAIVTACSYRQADPLSPNETIPSDNNRQKRRTGSCTILLISFPRARPANELRALGRNVVPQPSSYCTRLHRRSAGDC